jgi:hypothetical protein
MRALHALPLAAIFWASTAAAQNPAPPPGSVDSDRNEDTSADGPFYRPNSTDKLMAPPPPAEAPPAPVPSRASAWLETHAFIGGRITGTASGVAARYSDMSGVGLFGGVMFNNRLFFVGFDGGRNFAKKLGKAGGGGLYILYPHFEARIMSPLTEKHWVLGVGTSATGLRYASACSPNGGTGFTAELRVLTVNVWTSFFDVTDHPFSMTVGAVAEVGMF